MDPTKSVIFKTLGDSRFFSCLNFEDDPTYLYSMGYLRAGDVMVDYILEKGCYMDSLVYPILFNYRQYIELRLKEIIWSGRMLLDQEGRFPLSHNIANLWTIAKQLMDLTWKGADKPEEYILIDAVMADFVEVDAASDAFRYPRNRDGEMHLKGIERLDTPHIKEVIGKVARFLDGVSMGIGVYLDYKVSQVHD
jgi:hypothetical protein